MKITAKQWWLIFKDTGGKFLQDKPFVYSSSIAYFAIFSLPAIALITVMIAGSFYENATVKNSMLTQISRMAGTNSAQEVERLMNKITRNTENIQTKVISIATLIFSATSVFVILQESINSIWGIKPKTEGGLVRFLVNRLLSLAMIASMGFLVLVSLVTDTLIAMLKVFINQYFTGLAYYFLWLANTLISGALIATVFALIYMVLPDAKIKWSHAWIGAFITTILFIFGKYLIGFYLKTSNFTESYGAAGSLVALLAWVYYSVLILLFGAEFTYSYTRHVDGIIQPPGQAVAVKVEEIEQEETSAN
ncbi:YihY/virulence factor BrkB family protein [Desulfopila sp. IMCC35006]|uniref:YihY/virulence factor BrkB family protein n=1 Tax=Desulfopila sp. IMCC35006 TaxID=2569542 RepID=UPI0010AC2C81|nr:YihY/virulence factor BrkB family protein [Desulfopila sp. IMCC35006]TKB28354.1 YihY/virulence factor BrkB family protein [Desulfopila sp. IMCC35006]